MKEFVTKEEDICRNSGSQCCKVLQDGEGMDAEESRVEQGRRRSRNRKAGGRGSGVGA